MLSNELLRVVMGYKEVKRFSLEKPDVIEMWTECGNTPWVHFDTFVSKCKIWALSRGVFIDSVNPDTIFAECQIILEDYK